MTKPFLSLVAAIAITVTSVAQTEQRIAISSIVPKENTGQDYSPWLNDNTDNLVADAWESNMKYTEVRLNLSGKSLVNKLVFYDGAGVFTTNPCYLYALNGNEKTYIGKFEGPTYNTFITLNLAYPLLADAILVYKYSNNIPQKIQVFGTPYTPGMIVPETKLSFKTAIPSEETGQDYNLWFDDNVNNEIPWGNANSFKYIDVKIPLTQRSKIQRFRFWDTEGEFSSNPCFFYAIKDTQKTFLGSFTGPTYQTWVDLTLPEGITADTLFVHKYSRYIPQKIQAFGIPLLKDPTDTIAPPDGRIKITAIEPSENTGVDFTPWLNDDVNDLVQENWSEANYKYTDVKLTLERKSKIGRLSLFDDVNVYTYNPAYIYAVNDTTKTLIGKFEGLTYKTFVELLPVDSLVADAIIVHKFSNHIPQKIKVYGVPYTDQIVAPIDTTPVVIKDSLLIPDNSTAASGSINNPGSANLVPIDPDRWYQLNNVSDAIDKIFDGDTASSVNAGYGKIIDNYDAYYALKNDEYLDLKEIHLFDGEGSLGPNVVTMYAINRAGDKIKVATFNGDRYNQWVGPYPERANNFDGNFKLDSVIKDVRYLVLNCWYMYPNEIRLYGDYTSSSTAIHPAAPVKNIKFKDATGINAFEWDFESPFNPTKIDSLSYVGIKNFKGVRHYMDWEKLESNEGKYTYNPVHSGGWNYDAIYDSCKADGITVVACLKTIPSWMQATYPEDKRDSENIPMEYGKDASKPESYIKQAKLAFQYIARYGSNKNIDPALLSVNSNPRWNHDDINEVKIGLGTIKYIECDNERDKWWKGRQAYQTSYEYAANLSAFYDGHMKTMGTNVGVKNADSTVQVVMGGVAAPDPHYVRGMIEWCKKYRGYKADGTVNLCWDVINYHLYSNDAGTSQGGYSTRGAAPEKSEAARVALAFNKLSHEEANNIPIWITELGYDEHQGSPLKAIPIGNKTALQTQADWILRSALLYAREGIDKTFFYQLYDDNPLYGIQFGSMGFLKPDKTRKPAADFLVQTNKLIGEYTYKETISADPLVDRYELDGHSAYVLTIPDEVGRTGSYNLSLPGIDSIRIYTPAVGKDTMSSSIAKLKNGQIILPVSETPIFVLPIGIETSLPAQMKTSSTTATTAKAATVNQDLLNGIWKKTNVFPNPAVDYINVNVAGSAEFTTEIKVIEPATGRTLKSVSVAKTNGFITKRISLRNLPTAIYKVQIKQGNDVQYKSVMKVSK